MIHKWKTENKRGKKQLKVDGIIYEDAYSQAEIINESFQSIFTRESSFIESCETTEKIEVNITAVLPKIKRNRRKNQKERFTKNLPGIPFSVRLY